MAASLAAFIASGGVALGLLAGLAAGLTFVACAFVIDDRFGRRSLRLWAINAGHNVVTFTLMGLLIGLLQSQCSKAPALPTQGSRAPTCRRRSSTTSVRNQGFLACQRKLSGDGCTRGNFSGRNCRYLRTVSVRDSALAIGR